jgi:hypothetical protein
MKAWSSYRRAAWKVDERWSVHRLIVHTECVKGAGRWGARLRAPSDVIKIDEAVAGLADCAIAGEITEDQEFPSRPWRTSLVFFDDDDDWDSSDLAEDRWEEQYRAIQARMADLLCIHYLLPHVRLYQKLRVFELSERAYYYRLMAALDALERYASRDELDY